jgi:hypothetical protein
MRHEGAGAYRLWALDKERRREASPADLVGEVTFRFVDAHGSELFGKFPVADAANQEAPAVRPGFPSYYPPLLQRDKLT